MAAAGTDRAKLAAAMVACRDKLRC